MAIGNAHCFVSIRLSDINYNPTTVAKIVLYKYFETEELYENMFASPPGSEKHVLGIIKN